LIFSTFPCICAAGEPQTGEAGVMTPEEFVAALDVWSATGGKFRDGVPDDHKVTTPAEAEAVCRGLDSPHIYTVNSIGSPALSELVHFFQTVRFSLPRGSSDSGKFSRMLWIDPSNLTGRNTSPESPIIPARSS
jgi:hypothetical protein